MVFADVADVIEMIENMIPAIRALKSLRSKHVVGHGQTLRKRWGWQRAAE